MSIDDVRIADPSYDDPKMFQKLVDPSQMKVAQMTDISRDFKNLGVAANGPAAKMPPINADPTLSDQVDLAADMKHLPANESILTGVLDASARLADDVAEATQGMKPEESFQPAPAAEVPEIQTQYTQDFNSGPGGMS